MSHAIAAELQVLLEGVPLPARKPQLLAYAREHDADERMLNVLRGLPEREYAYLDEVGETVARVQPERKREQPQPPREESDAVPGGEDYTRVPTDTGRVRDRPQAVEQQKQLSS